MKGVADFLIVLVAAVLFLGVLFLVTEVRLGDWGSKTGVARSDVVSFGQVYLGFTSSDIARSVYFDDMVVGQQSLKSLKNAIELEISKGMFSDARQEISIEIPQETLSDAVGGKIIFDVSNTNQYGELVIVFNGKELFNKNVPTGRYEISIPKNSMKTENILIVYATGPGAKFWASTVYVLRDFSFNAVIESKQALFFNVFSEEIDIWNTGVMNFQVAKASSENSKLIASINGKEIYNKFPTATQLELGVRDIRPGTNVLTFKSENGYFNLQNLYLNVILWKNKTLGVSKSFVLSESQYGEFNRTDMRGVVQITINRIVKPSALEIKFKANSEKSVFITNLKEREAINATFDYTYLRPGNNIVTLSTDGAIDVSSADLWFERA
ncbi:MAG: hypothetical protein V1731_03150 [Candidatus Aenigmatarchaeota archaeon]